jgi:putative spermidine/putrescine transport system permease protein
MKPAAKQRPRGSAAALLVPATLFVLAFLALPLLLLLRYSFNRFVPGQFMVEAFTLENYAKFVSDAYYRDVLATTVTMSAAVTAICLAAGFPAAMFLARVEGRRKSLLILAVVLPLFVGNAVRAAGWMLAFGRQGIVNYLLAKAGLADAPLELLYRPGAVLVGIVAVNLPFVVLTLQSVLEGLDPRTEEAALSLGASSFETWRLVTLPLVLPGVIAAAVLCFILSMNAYATPVLLGGPQFHMMAPSIADQILQQNNWPFGASLAFVLMLVTLVLTGLANAVVQRRRG